MGATGVEPARGVTLTGTSSQRVCQIHHAPVVPRTGVEPARPEGHRGLNAARLPGFRHLGVVCDQGIEPCVSCLSSTCVHQLTRRTQSFWVGLPRVELGRRAYQARSDYRSI